MAGGSGVTAAQRGTFAGQSEAVSPCRLRGISPHHLSPCYRWASRPPAAGHLSPAQSHLHSYTLSQNRWPFPHVPVPAPRILHLQMLHSPRSPRKGTWVSIWLQNRALSADAWILAQNEPASKPQQGLGSTASFCQVVAEARMG